jgi:predicted small lipoprotein YifL
MLPALPFRTPLRLLAFLLFTLFTACGGDAPKDEPPAEVAADASQADAPDAPGQSANSAPLSADDIERWEKGMDAELAAVREAGAKLESAKTGEDTLSALMGVQEMTTTPVGAQAAAMDQERYQTVRSNLAAAVAYLTPYLGGIDTTMLSVAQREEMRVMNAAQLKQLEGTVPAELIEVLKPKAEALRKKEIELAGARLKGAGM